MYECSLCGVNLGENPLTYWCSRCYADWKEAIFNKEPWTVFLANLEGRRRYREQDMRELGIQMVYLSEGYDIAMVKGEVKLVYREGED